MKPLEQCTMRCLFKKAERVVIFAFERHYDGKKTDMDALVAHLANHGVKARVEGWTDTGDIDAVSALFACLDRDDIDLLWPALTDTPTGLRVSSAA